MIAEFNRNTITQLNPATPYQETAKKICLDWLEGREKFELTTSGSTGKPKKIEVTSSQIRASVYATSRALSLPDGTNALACINIEFVGGFMMLIRAMELDWNVVLLPPSSNPLLLIPEDYSFDFTALVPMQLSEMLTNPQTSPKVEKLGKILLGGVGLTAEQNEHFSQLSQEVYMGYGMTETVSHIALRQLKPDSERNIYSVVDNIEFGTDERGCLFFKGEVTNQQLLQTNDLAETYPDKRAFRLFGRIDNVVNSGGIKIQIEEIEQKLGTSFRKTNIQAPFFLWKMPDPKLGETLVLVVKGSAEELELPIKEVISRDIERLKKPRKLFFTDEFLTTGSQKVDKYRTFEGILNRR